MDSSFVTDTELSDKHSQTSFPRFLCRHQLCSQQDRPRNGSLVSYAGALVGIEVEALLASANDTLAVDASYRVSALDESAVLAFADAQASTAGLAVDRSQVRRARKISHLICLQSRGEVQAVPAASALERASSDFCTGHLGIETASVGSSLTVQGVKAILLGLLGHASAGRGGRSPVGRVIFASVAIVAVGHVAVARRAAAVVGA